MKKILKFIIDWFRKIISSPFISIPFFITLILIIHQKFISQSSDILKGAFYGVIASYFTYNFVKSRELKAKRFNCMVYLEQEMNLCRNSLSDNIFQLEGILSSQNPTVLFPSEVTLSEVYIKDLGRINLREDIFIFYVGLKKFDHSLNALATIYERNMANFTNTSFPSIEKGRKAFENFYSFYKKQAKDLKTAGQTLEDELKDCMVKLRFFLRVDKPMFNRFSQTYYSKRDYAKWIIDDKERLENELEETKKSLV